MLRKETEGYEEKEVSGLQKKKIAFSTGPVNLKIAPGLLTPSVCTGL